MGAGVKLVIGIIIFLLGIYWYLPNTVVTALFGRTAFQSFLTVFEGLFGIALIVLGLIVAWIEYEDIKWSRKGKKK